jgi:hypothetical protein
MFRTWEAAIAIRVQLGPMPAMLSEIVVQMLGDSETIVVGRSVPGNDPLSDARESGAQLLVVRKQPGCDQALDQIVATPGLSILLISDDGRDGSLIRLAQQPLALNRKSISRLARDVAGVA